MTARARFDAEIARIQERFNDRVRGLASVVLIETSGPIDFQRTIQEGMLRGLEAIGERPCMIAGSFPWLPPTPAPVGAKPPDRAAPAPRRKWQHRSMDLALRYVAPWTRPNADEGRPEANVWNVEHGPDGLTILAIVRINDVAAPVPVSVPVCRARTAHRRIVSEIGNEVFAIESTAFPDLPRLRLILRNAPVDVAQKLRSMP